ncbi:MULTISPECIES: lipid-binding SYLF domain-containing protein [unclassified Lysobacter]|uniref:lipid-binding SYLF domain-containing protein n=1 Tax=unclassified Lysobacter TaxID=2635362 RepID=UPI001C212697|nr:lipid-binding SYLF domain-containing protein [Lysobacter sp. MMG2]MBU8977286.1 lipid-binding SYLF domain-containing protein [Lysobacter sp. MMG2]
MSRLPRLLVLSLALSVATAAVAGPQEDERARQAVRVLTDIQQIPESGIPDKLLDEARGIVVVPDALKIGLVLGGRRGHGLLSVKNPDGTWSNPSFVKLTGGSIGFQAGVQSADIVLVFRSDRGLDSIVNGKVTLGADAGVAAGPVGRNASTATDGQLKAEIWSWSRARGLFAGIALDGAVLSIDDTANESVYGQDTTPRMIFEGRANGQPSTAVVDFRDRLEEASNIARTARTNADADERARTSAPRPAPKTTENRAPSGAASTTPMAPAQPATKQPSAFETVESPVQAEPLP